MSDFQAAPDAGGVNAEASTVELHDANQQATNAPEETASEGLAEQEQGKQQPERTFSQAELDAAVQKRLLRERRRWEREQYERSSSQQAPRTPEGGQEQPQGHGKPEITDADIEAHLARKRSQEAVASFAEKVEDAEDRYPDYIRTVTDPRVPFSDEMIEFFADSDVGVDLAYQLAKEPAKVREILRMSPLKAGRELTRLEAEIKAKPPVAKPSKAPEPIEPVGRRATSSASSEPNDDDDMETWARKERERERKRRA